MNLLELGDGLRLDRAVGGRQDDAREEGVLVVYLASACETITKTSNCRPTKPEALVKSRNGR